ncbi:MAG: NADH-quinone oxidoreductase subunit NuoN [Pseudomonadota bacterium]
MLDIHEVVLVLAPELLLAAAALVGVVAGAIFRERFTAAGFQFGAATLVAAAILSWVHYEGGVAFDGLARTNPFVNFAKIVAYLSAAVALIMSEGFLRRQGTTRFEYPLLMIFAALGMGVILSAADLMTLYMGIETLSLSSYVLAAFHRDSVRSSEAGLKYFVLGALASGLLLYGSSLVYGFTGTTKFAEIALETPTIGMLFGLVLMITGLAFKISAAPMHVWTPDVYEGAPSPVVAFFAAAPKMAGVVVFANVLFTAFGPFLEDWQLIVAIIAGASMLVGAFGALAQNNLKRLLAYSSIANVGYALVAVAAGAELGAQALLIFMTLYVIGTIGLFAGVLAMRRRGGMVEDVSELSGLSRNHPVMAIGLTALVLSVAGIPFLGGFFGKLYVILAGLAAGLVPLVVLLIISSVISLAYYLRIIKVMWFDEPQERFESIDTSVSMTVVGSAILCAIVFVVFVGGLVDAADVAALGLNR